MSVLRSSVLVGLTLSTGCFGSLTYYGDQALDAGTDANTPTQPGTTSETEAPPLPDLQIDSVDPAFGSNAGGQSVVIHGAFEGASSVLFDGQPATVEQGDATEIVVTSPPHAGVGPVAVEIRGSGQRSDVLDDAFTYFGDATGSAGAIGAIERVHQVGGYWSSPVVDLGFGYFAFVEGPSDWQLRFDFVDPATWSPTTQPCSYEYARPDDPTLAVPGASTLSFDSPSATIALPDVGKLWKPGWYAAEIPEALVVPGARYDLEPVQGDPAWPGFGLAAAVEIPDDWQITSPVMTGTTPPKVTRQPTLRWSGSGGDHMVLFILRQYQSGKQWVDDGRLTCVFPDNGVFQLPLDAWPNWFQDDFLHIQLGRVMVDSQPLPHTNADNRVAGIHWIYGGGVTQ